jgi:hypothetical protein
MLALMPLGGSMVILELFWSTGTGNLGLGMLVNHRRKSRCTCIVSRDSCRGIKKGGEEGGREKVEVRTEIVDDQK